EHVLGRLAGGEPRAVRLEVAPARARSLARLAVEFDDDVSELGPAAVEAASDHGSAADAGAERQHHHVVRAVGGAEGPLGEGGRVRVVLDPDWKAESARDEVTERQLAQRDVHRAVRDALRLVDPGRDADAERGDTGLE